MFCGVVKIHAKKLRYHTIMKKIHEKDALFLPFFQKNSYIPLILGVNSIKLLYHANEDTASARVFSTWARRKM